MRSLPRITAVVLVVAVVWQVLSNSSNKGTYPSHFSNYDDYLLWAREQSRSAERQSSGASKSNRGTFPSSFSSYEEYLEWARTPHGARKQIEAPVGQSESERDAEMERMQREQAERERLAVVEAGKEKATSCMSDLQCWSGKHSIKASSKCRPHIERLSEYSFEWTDGFFDAKFSRVRWKNKAKGRLTYIGDKIKFQNGFGAWQYITYSCDYDPIGDVVLHVDARPGRLPP